MRVLKDWLILISLPCAIWPGLTAQTTLQMKVDSFMQQQIQPGEPGAAIAVLKDGDLLLAKGYGLANLAHQIPFTIETVSDLGSVAKQFTCYAINMLESQGVIKSVLDPVSDYLEYFDGAAGEIRILDLMHHTSGLREVYTIQAMLGHRGSDGIKQSDASQLVRRSQALNFAPGSQYMYCNTAYMILADLVTHLTGEEFESWMQDHVFNPLGMAKTYVMDVQGEVFPNMAESYVRHSLGFRRVFDNSTGYGQGGLYSTIPDLVKWMEHLLRPQDHDWTSSEAITNLWSTTGQVFPDGSLPDYGRGLVISPYRGLQRIGHTGSSAGYRMSLQLFPESDLGIVIKTNRPDIDREAFIDLVLEELVDLNERSNSHRPDVQLDSLDVEKPSNYLGSYLNSEYDAIYHISVEGKTLQLDHIFHGKVPLRHRGDQHFTSPHWFFSDLHFKLDDSGRVMGFSLDADRVRKIWFQKLSPQE